METNMGCAASSSSSPPTPPRAASDPGKLIAANKGGRLADTVRCGSVTFMYSGTSRVTRYAGASAERRFVELAAAEFDCEDKRTAVFRLDHATLGVPPDTPFRVIGLTLLSSEGTLRGAVRSVDTRSMGDGRGGLRADGDAIDALLRHGIVDVLDGATDGGVALALPVPPTATSLTWPAGTVYVTAAAEGVELRLTAALLVGLPNTRVPEMRGLTRCYETFRCEVRDDHADEAVVTLSPWAKNEGYLTYVAAAVPGVGVLSIELLLDGKVLMGASGGAAQLEFAAWMRASPARRLHPTPYDRNPDPYTLLCLPLSSFNEKLDVSSNPRYLSSDLDLGAPAVVDGMLQLRVRLRPGCSRGDGVVHVLASLLR
jgi:hypothetical protein